MFGASSTLAGQEAVAIARHIFQDSQMVLNARCRVYIESETANRGVHSKVFTATFEVERLLIYAKGT